MDNEVSLSMLVTRNVGNDLHTEKCKMNDHCHKDLEIQIFITQYTYTSIHIPIFIQWILTFNGNYVFFSA